jgi:hypothetical protein
MQAQKFEPPSGIDNIVAIPFKNHDTLVKKEKISSFFPDLARESKLNTMYSKSIIGVNSGIELTNKPRRQENSSFLFILILMALLLYAKLRHRSYRKINNYYKAVFVPRVYNQMERDENILTDRTSILFFIVYLVSFSLLIFNSLPEIHNLNCSELFGKSIIFKYSAILILVFALYVFKTLMLNMLSVIFKTTKITKEYRSYNYLVNIVIGLTILPLIFILNFTFSPILLYGVWAIFAFLTVVRFVKCAIIWLPNSNFFKFFLYFCTIEIIPLLIIAKFFYII